VTARPRGAALSGRAKGRALAWLAAAAGSLWAAGCTTHVPLAPDYAGPRPLPAELRTATVPSLEPVPLISDEVKERGRFVVRRLAVPSAADPGDGIEFEYYDVDVAGATPVVVLLPIFTGETTIPHYFARYFANRGWAAVVIERGRDPLASLDNPEEAVQRSLGDYRRVIDWLELQPEIDAERIGVFGISLGAMDAVMLTALDARIRALVVAMAGGDWPYLMLNTRYRPVVRTIDELAESRGMSREQLSRDFHAKVVTDPLELAPYIDAERVFMIMTRSDAIIPFESQEMLRERMGGPEALYLATGHRSSVLFFPKVRATAFEFLSGQFEPQHVALARH
jgi:hypothetical protein